MRLGVPYFAARQHGERLALYLQHGTSEISVQTSQCDCMHGDATDCQSASSMRHYYSAERCLGRLAALKGAAVVAAKAPE